MNDLIGRSEVIKKLRQSSLRVAATDSTVLITGESGTGKDVLARFVHENSKRSKADFVVVHAGSIPAELMENELFGHVRGAYTDAVTETEGFAGRASGGTLYIDEIGDFDLSIQAKLLRFIQYKSFQKIGGSSDINADVRILASSKYDLRSQVACGKFREDLYYRLMVIPLYIPPLRERIEDVPLLAEFFIGKYKTKSLVDVQVDNRFFADLCRYQWPGNVRELESFIENLIVFSGGEALKVPHTLLSENSADVFVSLKCAVDDFKKEYIIKALNKCSWNQTKAAKILDIQRTYLARLIRELKIDKL